MTLLGAGNAKAVSYYPNYFINQSFDGAEAWPAGWSGVSSTSCFFGHAAATYVVGSGYTKVSSSGSGLRGGEMRFPSTATSGMTDSIWVMEFDWTVNSADWSAKQANGFFVMGPNSANVNVNDTWYGDVAFGLYCYQNGGFIHLLNQDPIGLPKRDAGGEIIPNEFQGPVFYNQNGNNGKFTRQATASTTDWVTVDSLNMSTRTKVIMNQASVYHIFAEMNMNSQKIQKMTIIDVANPLNGDTILNLDFLAPWMVGTATTVPLENRVVSAIDRLASFHTRSGGSGALNHSYDNIQLYQWQVSLGLADVTVKYVDRNGNVIKDANTLAGQQVASNVSLAADDKLNFTSGDGQTLYFYDAEATHLANAAKGADGETLTVDYADAPNVDNSLTVVFKSVAATPGTYVWAGETNTVWSYLDDNFSVSNGAAQSYQPGNAVEFSKTDLLNSTVEVAGEIDLQDASMSVYAPNYVFSGTGKIVGNGSLNINAPTTLAVDNRLASGVIISTPELVSIKHANAGVNFTTSEPAISLGLEAGATFTKTIQNTLGGTLNLDMVSLNEYAPVIKGFNTINIRQGVQSNLNQATWRTGWGGSIADTGAVVNYFNDVVGFPVPNGLGITGTVMKNAKLKLNPHTRLVRQYNENGNSNDVVYIGELSGDSARLESGFVDGRYFRYEVGGLNTDAVFNGELGAYTKSYVAATDTTEEVTTYAMNGVGLTKAGTGSWTFNGNINYPTGTRGSQLNAAGGLFTVNGDVVFPNTSAAGSQINVTDSATMVLNGKVTFVTDTAAHTIKVTKGILELHDSIVAPVTNLIILTVDSAGVLKTGNNFIGASQVTVNGSIVGGGVFANSFALTKAEATLKLSVDAFEEGKFEFVEAFGDISIKAGIIDISVNSYIEGPKEITILKSGGNYDILDNIASIQVLVNGQNIIGNTVDTEVPEGSEIYYFDPETGILGHMGVTGLDDNFATKEIKTVEYHNMLGQQVTKYYLGAVIKKITYTDNSVQVVKLFNDEYSIKRLEK